MPRFIICVTNGVLHSRDDGGDYHRPEDALALGIESGLCIVADEVRKGDRSAAVEISVTTEAGKVILRSVLAISVVALMPTVGSSDSLALHDDP